MLSSASSTGLGAGTGVLGPINRVRWIPLSIEVPRYPFRQGDAQAATDGLGKCVRAHGAVGVGDAPELFGVGQVTRRDAVEPLAFRHHMLLKQDEAFGRRHEAAAQVDDRLAVGAFILRRLDAEIAAVEWKL